MISVDPLTRRFNSKVNQPQQPQSTINKQEEKILVEHNANSSIQDITRRIISLESNLSIIINDMNYFKDKLNKLENDISSSSRDSNLDSIISVSEEMINLNTRIVELDAHIKYLGIMNSSDKYDSILSRLEILESQISKTSDNINKTEEAAPKKTARRGIKLKAPSAE